MPWGWGLPLAGCDLVNKAEHIFRGRQPCPHARDVGTSEVLAYRHPVSVGGSLPPAHTALALKLLHVFPDPGLTSVVWP